MPISIHGEFAGTAKVFRQTVVEEPLLILASLVAVYIVLGVLYESLTQPITILSTLPSSGVGAVLALLLFGQQFTLIALIAVILLIGVVLKNAIMMVDVALETQRHGKERAAEAIHAACILRFRPIMMTTIAAMLGALPLAVMTGQGSEMRQPLGIAIVGGLFISQILTLYTTPVVYIYLDRFHLWVKRTFRRNKRNVPSAAGAATMSRGRGARPLVTAACALALSACAVGPNYHRPAAPPAPAFKEAQGWTPATPAQISSEQWWMVYDDPVLSSLEQQVEVSNQNLKAAVAVLLRRPRGCGGRPGALLPEHRARGGRNAQRRLRQPRRWPHRLCRGFRLLRFRASRPLAIAPSTTRTRAPAGIWTSGARSAASSRAMRPRHRRARRMWPRRASRRRRPWRRITSSCAPRRRSCGCSRPRCRTIRSLCRSRRTVSMRVWRRSPMSTRRARSSRPSSRRRTRWSSTRAKLEHAIAVLIGKAPAELAVAQGEFAATVPVAPAGLPSQLLLRRPDVAAAERDVESANAQIGVAESAWFPSLTLSGSFGYESSSLSKLIRASNSVWSFGPSFAETLFNGGATIAQIRENRALYDSAVATYRQTVLTAFQQVEDDLATLDHLQTEYAQQEEAVADAERSETLTLNQYKAGVADYASVLTAQTARLNSQITALNVQSQRLVASADLIDATGGGWNSAQLRAHDDGITQTLKSTVQ